MHSWGTGNGKHTQLTQSVIRANRVTSVRWRRLRRIAFGGFTVRASVDYQPMQEREAARLVAHLLRDPMQYDDHFKRYGSYLVTKLYSDIDSLNL